MLRRKASQDHLWIIEESALDETVRNVSFNVMVDRQFSSLKAPSHKETGLFIRSNAVAQSIDLTTERLADFFDKYQQKLEFSRPFLKMDTQGNDVAVARGAGDRLGCFVGLQSELAIKKSYQGQPDYCEAIGFYKSAGFELSAFVPNNLGHFPTLIDIDCIMYNAQMAHIGLR
jgi:hypothetical protein